MAKYKVIAQRIVQYDIELEADNDEIAMSDALDIVDSETSSNYFFDSDIEVLEVYQVN